MAQQEVHLDQEDACCSLCLDLLKDTVTVPCGHNYCSRCIEEYWDQDDQQGTFSCPGCSQTFTPRPVLKKNTMPADMMDIENTGLQAVPPDHCYDGREDVVCDFCTRRKLKAVKTCLQCRVSYCETHLQPHYQSPVFNNHKLVKASSKLPENICAHHDEVKELFCRTDQQCICSRCSVEEHKGHNKISAAAERAERQKTFDTSQQNIQQRIQERENDVKLLYQEVRSINHSADRAVDDSDTIFTKLTNAIKRRRTEVRELIRDQQKHDMSRVEEQMKCVEQELTELRRRHAELQQISHTEDPIQFLNSYASLSVFSESTDPVNADPLRSFEDVTVSVSKAVAKTRDKLGDIFKEEVTRISASGTRVDVLLSASPEPKTRANNKIQEPRDPRAKGARAKPLQKNKKIRADILETIKLEDVFKIKKMTKLFVVILFFVVTWTHPFRRSVHPQRIPSEPFKSQCLVQGHERREPGWLGTWWSEPPEPKTRAEFLQYYCPIRLDPNTAHRRLSLSEGNRKVKILKNKQSYPPHRERFINYRQVLSRVGVVERCYWEVEWHGKVDIAVSHKAISIFDSLNGVETRGGFGESERAWSLHCHVEHPNGTLAPFCIITHMKNSTGIQISALSERIGVYLDHKAGTLSFYSLSTPKGAWNAAWSSYTMTLLVRVEETFKKPLYAGFGFDHWKNDAIRKYDNVYAEFCDLE